MKLSEFAWLTARAQRCSFHLPVDYSSILGSINELGKSDCSKFLLRILIAHASLELKLFEFFT